MDDTLLTNDIIDTVKKYTAVFSQMEKFDQGIRFTDPNIPDMHYHNYFLLSDRALSHSREIETDEMSFRKNHHQNFYQIEIFDVLKDDVKDYFNERDLSETEFLSVPIDRIKLQDRELNVTVKIAESDADHEMGKEIDCFSFGYDMKDFAIRRYDRKRSEYDAKKIFNFICFQGDEVIGSCDFFINGKYGRIEDFDVIEKHQRKGYGSAILNEIRKFGLKNDVKILFLGVDKDNSAKEMYAKLGFDFVCSSFTYHKEIQKVR